MPIWVKNNIMNIRTDMALEAVLENDSGIKVKKSTGNFGIKRIDVKIESDISAKKTGKPKGRYITVEAENLYERELDFQHETAILISRAINDCMGRNKYDTVLVVGLGNKHMTADALGPMTVDKLIITRHMDDENEITGIDGSLCAISPGVLGITGIETYDIIKGVSDNIKPDLIISVDALASRSTHRISSAFQVTDTGIVPGAGVNNHQFKLSKETLNVPVISIGVPLVVYASTLSLDIIEQCFERSPELKPTLNAENKLISNILTSSLGDLVVTPKDIDTIVQKCAYVLAVAINMSIHKDLSLNDITGLIH